ncbi:unnamed protein product [Prunus brigantina]
MWRAITGSIPTGANLFRRKLSPSPLCRLCGLFPETVEHMLLLCPWTRAARCQALFNDHQPSPLRVLSHATSLMEEFSQALELATGFSHLTSNAPPCVHWSPPLFPCFKINIDGAWEAKSGLGGVGVVIRDHNGAFVGATCQSCNFSSAEECEAHAAIVGLSFALSLQLHHVVVETDCLELFSCVKNDSASCNWRFYTFLAEFRRLEALFRVCDWNWIRREANGAADAAAELAKRRLRFCNWVNIPPPSLVSVLLSDGLPAPP